VTKLNYFNQDNPLPFLSVPSVVFTGSLLVFLKTHFVGDEDADLEMDIFTADARSDHRLWQPQPYRPSSARLLKFATALLICSCGSSSQMDVGRHSTQQSSYALAGVYRTFPA